MVWWINKHKHSPSMFLFFVLSFVLKGLSWFFVGSPRDFLGFDFSHVRSSPSLEIRRASSTPPGWEYLFRSFHLWSQLCKRKRSSCRYTPCSTFRCSGRADLHKDSVQRNSVSMNFLIKSASAMMNFWFVITVVLKLLGTLRSEDGDDRENVAEKVSSCSFSLHRDYSKSLSLWNVRKPF